MNVSITPSIGDNSSAVPLTEILAEETAELERRAKDLAAAVGRAAVKDEDSAGKATLLAKMIAEHRKDIGNARVARKEPFLVAGRIVDQHFGSIDKLLADRDSKGKVVGGPLASVIGMIDAYRREQEEKAASERRRLEEEARKQREAAEAAERARLAAEERARVAQEEAARVAREAEEAAKRAGDAAAAAEAKRAREAAEALRQQEEAAARERRLQAEIDLRRAADAADELDRQAAATKVTPIDSGFGAKASGRKSYSAEITDLAVALKHAIKVDRAAVLAAVQGIYDRQVKAGVRVLPGATVHESSSTIIR